MIIQEEYENYLYIKCEKCGTVHKKHKTFSKKYGEEIHINPPIQCQCGNVGKIVTLGYSTASTQRHQKNDEIECPNCGSTQIAANPRGFSVGKATVGTALFGIAGAIGGFIDSNKTMITCLKCGYKWEAGK
jgi:DNA-directed RNA polymerase subunit RPC12/RpoP